MPSSEPRPTTETPGEIEATVRSRIRALRQSMGLSLDDLAERSHLSASTISRIETGKRGIGLDVLVALARALHVDVGELIEIDQTDADVIIRPKPMRGWHGAMVWPLSRPTSPVTAIRTRLEPSEHPHEPQVHPGHDWVYVMEGKISLRLGNRHLVVSAGEAAEFTTMTPHSINALDGTADVMIIFDRDGQRAHMRTDTP